MTDLTRPVTDQRLIDALRDDETFARVFRRWLDRPLGEEVTINSRLVDDLDLDSIDFLYLLISIEDAIGRKIDREPGEYFGEIDTVGDVQQALLRLLTRTDN